MFDSIFGNPLIIAIIGGLLGFKLRIIPLCIITIPVLVFIGYLFIGYHWLNPLEELAILITLALIALGTIFLVSMWIVAGLVRVFTLRTNSQVTKVAESIKQKLFR